MFASGQHFLPTAGMENNKDKLLASPLGLPSMFPPPSTSAPVFSCASLFPPPFTTMGFAQLRAMQAIAEQQQRVQAFIPNQDVAQQQLLAVGLASNVNSLKTTPEEPSAKRIRSDAATSCPICGETLSCDEITQHLIDEKAQLNESLQNLKGKRTELDDVEDLKSEIDHSMKTRLDAYYRIKENQKTRFHDKMATFGFRDNRTPTSDKGEAEQDKTPSGTPVTSEVDSTCTESATYCKWCQKPDTRFKANTQCPHLMCANCSSCLEKEENDPLCCPVCQVAFSFHDLHTVML